MEEIMDYKKIPTEEIEWVKSHWKVSQKDVINKLKEWKVINPSHCSTCSINGTVGEFLKYWIREKLI